MIFGLTLMEQVAKIMKKNVGVKTDSPYTSEQGHYSIDLKKIAAVVANMDGVNIRKFQYCGIT